MAISCYVFSRFDFTFSILLVSIVSKLRLFPFHFFPISCSRQWCSGNLWGVCFYLSAAFSAHTFHRTMPRIVFDIPKNAQKNERSIWRSEKKIFTMDEIERKSLQFQQCKKKKRYESKLFDNNNFIRISFGHSFRDHSSTDFIWNE